MNELRERRPTMPGWVSIPVPEQPHDLRLLAFSAWQRRTACVISGLENAELPDRSGLGPQWHISVSRFGRRPTAKDVDVALRGFDLVGAEEDNHHPGGARHFWLPVDPAHRVDCECKSDEKLIVEPDGYRWTNPTEGLCRGCEFGELTGKPCLLHPIVRAP